MGDVKAMVQIFGVHLREDLDKINARSYKWL
jgi:hypothetical protein